MSWIEAERESELYVSVLTVGALEEGVAKLPESRRTSTLRKWLRDDLAQRFQGRVIPIDSRIAQFWGRLVGAAEVVGQPLPVIVSLIAASAQVHGFTVVTRNLVDFRRCGVTCLDPWSE